MLFCDNGSEFSSQVMDLWAYHSQVKIDFSRLGKPNDNAQMPQTNSRLHGEKGSDQIWENSHFTWSSVWGLGQSL